MLSICILYHDGDRHFLKGLAATLPAGCEVVLLHTQEGSEDTVTAVERKPNGVHAEYTYTGKLDLSKARNEAKKLASRSFILSLDPDERLLTHQHQDLQNTLYYAKPDVGAFIMRNFYVIPAIAEQNGYARHEILVQMKLFRNLPELHWDAPAHETIDKSLIESGYGVQDTNLFVHHIGYECTLAEFTAKIERNNRLIGENPGDYHQQVYKAKGEEFIKKYNQLVSEIKEGS